MYQAGTIPYLYSKKTKKLKLAVIGLGTGITAGFLATRPEVDVVKVLEISSSVIKASKFFNDYNFQLGKNPKVQIINVDAVRYFLRGNETFDIIISQPNQFWAAGIENLLTKEFYKIIKSHLTADGVFLQWIPAYSTTNEMFLSTAKNILANFSDAKLFQLSKADIGILASNSTLQLNPNLNFNSKFLPDLRFSGLMLLRNKPGFETLLNSQKTKDHTIETPKIAYWGDRARFTKEGPTILNMLLQQRYLDASKKQTFELLNTNFPSGAYCSRGETNLVCWRFNEMQRAYKKFLDNSKPEISRIKAYNYIRLEGIYEKDFEFLIHMQNLVLKKITSPPDPVNVLSAAYLAEEFMNEGVIAQGKQLAQKYMKNSGLSAEQIKKISLEVKDRFLY